MYMERCHFFNSKIPTAVIVRTLPLNYGKTFSALMVKKYLDSVDFMVKNVLDLVTIKKSEIQKKI